MPPILTKTWFHTGVLLKAAAFLAISPTNIFAENFRMNPNEASGPA